MDEETHESPKPDGDDSAGAARVATVREGRTPTGCAMVTYGRQSFALLADQPGMTGYLARKYVVTDRGSFFTNGAFARTIADRPAVPHLYQHFQMAIIGVNKNPVEDTKGLKIDAVLNENNQLAAETMDMYRFGDQHGWVPDWSIGFDPIEERGAKESELAKLDFSGAPHYADAKPGDLRAITQAGWWEGSTVTYGAIHNAGPDVIHSLIPRFDDDMLDLFAALRAGRLSPTQRRRMESFLVARSETIAAGTNHGTSEPSAAQTSPDRRAEIAAVQATLARLRALELAA